MSDLLIEIGVEEFPSPILDVVYNDLPEMARKTLQTNRIDFKDLKVEATPRRLVLFVEGIETKQADQDLEFSGPSYEKAFEGGGKPTKALEGFLRSKNATVKDVQIKETPKGKFVFVQKKEKGKQVKTILPQILEELFLAVPFPKMMRWEASGFRFPRPVRWIVALLDKQTIRMSLAGLKSSNQSFGHRFLAPKSFKVLSANWSAYLKLLKKHHVLLDLNERKRLVRDGLAKQFKQKKADEDLVHTTAQLVEEPFLISGQFVKDYLELPAEVLATCMKKHQKIFACYDTKGKLKNQFVAVLNGRRKGLAKIQADFENVLESRLRDARFFYEADTKEHLETRLSSLDQIVYLGKLGSMLDKTKRMEQLAHKFCDAVGKPELANDLKRVAELSKIDLMTQMVFEFPELQGIVGGEYALKSGESKEVGHAIATQYLPKNLSESHQNVDKSISTLGAIFGIIDRLDLLVGAFGTGVEPSGSQDPFALRRAGGVLIKLVRAKGFHFPLMEMIEANVDLYGDKLTVSEHDILAKVKEFFKERILFELEILSGSRPFEIFQAVSMTAFNDLADVFERYEILNDMYKADYDAFLRAAKVVERTGNISKKAEVQASALSSDLLQEPSEQQVFRTLEEKSEGVLQAFKQREYVKATHLFGQAFYDPIHDFFQQVMVNVEDTKIRDNRQALMKRVHQLYADHLADLSILSRIDQE